VKGNYCTESEKKHVEFFLLFFWKSLFYFCSRKDIMDVNPKQEEEVKRVPGNGDCSVLAFVVAMIALILSLKPSCTQERLYKKLMELVYNRETSCLIPQQLRLAVAIEAHRRQSKDTDYQSGIENLGNPQEFLGEIGSDLFFNIVAELFQVNVIVSQVVNKVLYRQPFPLTGKRYPESVFIKNGSGHYDAIVPKTCLSAIESNLGTTKYMEWVELFFLGSDHYTVEIPTGKSTTVYVDGEKIEFPESRFGFDMDKFHRDLTTCLVVQKAPEWKGAYLANLENLRKKPRANMEQLDIDTAVYNSLSAEEQNKLDKAQFDAISEAFARQLALENN
jgi:hypothetical protein